MSVKYLKDNELFNIIGGDGIVIDPLPDPGGGGGGVIAPPEPVPVGNFIDLKDSLLDGHGIDAFISNGYLTITGSNGISYQALLVNGGFYDKGLGALSVKTVNVNTGALGPFMKV